MQEGLRKLRSAQILRSLASKDDFTKAAGEVSQNIGSLAKYLDENRSNYVQLGRSTDAERDVIEQQIGTFSKTCSRNIEKLQSMVDMTLSKTASTPNSSIFAHRQGMVLILSERLAWLTSTFDGMRAIRYRQLMRNAAAKRRRTPKTQKLVAQNRHHGDRNGDVVQQPQQQQQQVVVDRENEILQSELLRSINDVEYAERTVREISTLNQMFSTAILHQSHQIESLYNQAVAVTGTLGSANVQLGKAVRMNRSSQWCMFLLLLFASLGILFLDWWYS